MTDDDHKLLKALAMNRNLEMHRASFGYYMAFKIAGKGAPDESPWHPSLWATYLHGSA